MNENFITFFIFSSSESVLYREIDPLKSASNLLTLTEPTNFEDSEGDRATGIPHTIRVCVCIKLSTFNFRVMMNIMNK